MPRGKNELTDLRRQVKDKYGNMPSLGERGALTWGAVDPTLLRAAAAAVTEDGAALLLSKTSDGGALCLQVWTESGRHRLYPSTAIELTEALQLLIETASA